MADKAAIGNDVKLGRLAAFLDEIATGLDAAVRAGEREPCGCSGAPADSDTVNSAAGYLLDLGFPIDAQRLKRTFDGLVHDIVGEWATDHVEEHPEDVASWVENFGSFPAPPQTPAERQVRQDRRLILMQRMRDLAEFVRGLRRDVCRKAAAASEKRKKSRPSKLREREVREGIRQALDDQERGIPVETYKGRIIKAEVASRCSNVSKNYLKETEEWRFYYEHGYLRPEDEPTEAERSAAAQLLKQLLPDHQHLKKWGEHMNEADKLDFVTNLTKLLIPVAKMPEENDRIRAAHETLKQFSDEKAKRILPLVTCPGENTQAVPRFEATSDEEN